MEDVESEGQFHAKTDDNRFFSMVNVDYCVGIAGAVSYKLDEDIELLIVTWAALTNGLGVALAGSLRKDMYDRMTAIEKLLQRWNINDKVNRLYP